MTVKTRAEVLADIATFINDNNSGDVTPEDVRERMIDLADSASFPEDAGSGGGSPSICEGRLTTQSGVAISTSDRTAQATLYFTPFRGNKIGLYTGTEWTTLSFTEKSFSLSGYTTAKPYDIFAYINAGVVAIESLVWTNDTTRATALTTQDGILVKSGDATRRYLGTIYTTATGQTEDSAAKRMVWNYYNRAPRAMRVLESTNTWSWSNASWRQANGSAANQLEMVLGLDEEAVQAHVVAISNDGGVGIGLDSTSGVVSGSLRGFGATGAVYGVTTASFKGHVGVGRHRLTWLEYGNNFYGDATATVQSGIDGMVQG